MSITGLTLIIGIVALVFTALLKVGTDRIKNVLISFFQSFCGFLFIFSGWVKIVDPMGTAFKMEQYFAEFESAFNDSWMSFVSPLFPMLSSMSLSFSVFMLVLEIALGVMLVIGFLPRLTSWLFFLIILFFTFLTGFTYLTGYVPSDSTFFQFSNWGPYVETNMKVTDCGCFGDFIKLKPQTSFLKDVFLLIPAILFLFRNRDFHLLFDKNGRLMTIGLSVFILFIYALYNFYWNEPHIDFRPFQEGVNIREQKMLEEQALSNVEVTMVIKNKEDGRIVQLPQAQYMKEFKSYPKEEWEFLDPIKSEPSIASTKISEFMVEDIEGNEVGEEILAFEDYSFVIICHKYKGKSEFSNVVVYDTIFVTDTVITETGDTSLVQRVDSVNESTELIENFFWDAGYVKIFEEKIIPLVAAAQKDDVKVYGIVGSASPDAVRNFTGQFETEIEFYRADDILLKTIQRSNPGVLLMKDGLIIKKWHHRQLPSYEKIFDEYLKK